MEVITEDLGIRIDIIILKISVFLFKISLIFD